ncbi:MFS transporter [Janthinobacterium sp. HLX7-2]|uniref:MFS transporter n=1 Tax=Janthinobacterium sp. HLX7-2 TaxID=1259331 RepID=UPI003F26DF96
MNSAMPRYRPARAWSITFFLFIFMMVNYIDKVALGLVAAPIMSEFNLTPTEFGLLASSFYWLFPIACVAGGFLANKYRAKSLLLIMALMWSLAQLPIIFAGSMVSIMLARILLGIGEGPASSISTHAIFKWFPNERRNLPQTVMLMGATCGLMVASIAIPQIAAKWGWRTCFEVLGVIGLVWAALWWWLGAEGNLDSAAPANNVAPAVERKIPYRTLLCNPTVMSTMMLFFVADWMVVLATTWLPLYLQKGLGFDAVAGGKLFALVVAVSIPINLLVSFISQRMLTSGLSSRKARGAVASIATVVAGLLLIALVAMPVSAMQKVYLLAAAVGLAISVFTLAIGIIGEVVPVSQRGAMLSISNAVATVGTFPAPVITGWLIQSSTGVSSSHGYEMGFLVAAVLMLIGAFVGYKWIDPEKARKALASWNGVPVREAKSSVAGGGALAKDAP